MMMMKLGKKSALTLAALAMPLVLTGCANVLRVAPHAELKVFDPVWTTAYITRNHGYLIYDTLFAMDENFEPKPQMVEKWTVSPDNKTWTFTLREGQKWHDGTDVTAEDCVASLQRWSKRDGAGQQLFRDVESLTAQDARSFTLKLREPNGQVLQILAKVSANVPFMMPKAVAATDPFTPITSKVGSGPYRYSWAQSRPFVKTVYLKNNNYVPRAEPLSMTAGSKAGQADRIEWIYHDTQEDMARSLIRGKVDYVESPSARVLPLFEGEKKVVVNTTDPLGNIAMARFNMLQPFVQRRRQCRAEGPWPGCGPQGLAGRQVRRHAGGDPQPGGQPGDLGPHAGHGREAARHRHDGAGAGHAVGRAHAAPRKPRAGERRGLEHVPHLVARR